MTDQSQNNKSVAPPRLVAWEITRRCNLHCSHCRASSENAAYEGELTTEEILSVVDGICQVGSPILILSGGEPLARQDIFTIADYAASKGLRVAVGTNGTLLTPEIAARLKKVPVARVSVSIDFPYPELQDRFRGAHGAFQTAMKGIEYLREAGVEIQINSTITRQNASYIAALLDLALNAGAVAFHPFMLVPTGRGKNLGNDELPAEEYERILSWINDKQIELGEKIFFKPTDAPHYWRIIHQKKGNMQNVSGSYHGSQQMPSRQQQHHGINAMTRGCLAGSGFCFISHTGRVQGCGYLDVEAGNVKKDSFKDIWTRSPLFMELRDLSLLKGKCGICEFKKLCGGCRARAYEMTGDYLGPEPYCIYEPAKMKEHTAL
ncbi:MAG: radical SAM protein [Dehalococcoidia bacterium]|nr:radical SAM protein [Dehalococcoidia bacterium]MDZ4247483.1 radical SAM protein [Dehalococcoidia bacterium]